MATKCKCGHGRACHANTRPQICRECLCHQYYEEKSTLVDLNARPGQIHCESLVGFSGHSDLGITKEDMAAGQAAGDAWLGIKDKS